ncbi:hypothetical protein [Geotalea sp. SG265]|uniref:hypothetical protein n=1 Tax=Geotalea sp. SG265 TaxID=2922867 RepID=UPI001FAFD96F|nr:hypothetical protein [Geotalea sp. SG265]
MEQQWNRLEVDLVEVADVLGMVHDTLVYSVDPSQAEVNRCAAAVSLAISRLNITTGRVASLVREYGKVNRPSATLAEV